MRRSVRIDTAGDVPTGVPARLDEVEFQRTVRPPADLRGTTFPGYYKRAGGWLTIGIAFRLRGSRLARELPGRFFYPLAAPAAGTGYAFDVNAPFEMNEDRSRLVPPGNSAWNAWLIDEAARLAVTLLPDLHSRYGLDAYRILTAPPTAAASVDELPAALDRLLCQRTGLADRRHQTRSTPCLRRRQRPRRCRTRPDRCPGSHPQPRQVLHRDLAADADLKPRCPQRRSAAVRRQRACARPQRRTGARSGRERNAPEISLYWDDYPNAALAAATADELRCGSRPGPNEADRPITVPTLPPHPLL